MVRKVSADTIAAMRAAYESGELQKQIAVRFGFAPQTVCRLLRAEHISLAIRRAVDPMIVAELRFTNSSYRAIADHVGVSWEKVYRVAKREGLLRPKKEPKRVRRAARL